MKVIPNDFGAHQRISSSGLVHASNTMRAVALKVRVTTSSRSMRSTLVRPFASASPLSFLASIDLLLAIEFLDDLVQLVEACGPELAVSLDPFGFFLEPAAAEPADAHAPDFLGRDEPGLLQNADVLLHTRQRHVELVGEIGDRGVRTRQLFQDAAPCGVRKGGEGGVEAGL